MGLVEISAALGARREGPVGKPRRQRRRGRRLLVNTGPAATQNGAPSSRITPRTMSTSRPSGIIARPSMPDVARHVIAPALAEQLLTGKVDHARLLTRVRARKSSTDCSDTRIDNRLAPLLRLGMRKASI